MGDGFVHMRWLSSRSAWQDMEYHRAKRAEAIAQDQANMDAVNSAMSSALQNKITISSNNAAKAALKRVQAATKAKSDQTTKQIDDTLKLIDKTKASAATTTTATTPTVLDTTA